MCSVKETAPPVSNQPKVLNKYHKNIPPNSAYIGRPSKYGNPFVIGKDGTREEVIAKYQQWLNSDEAAQLREEAVSELR